MSVTFVKPYVAEGRVEIPAAKYGPIYKENLRVLRRAAQLPGFRPGHVPTEYIRSRFGKETLERVLMEIFSEELDQALSGRPRIGIPFIKREPAELAPEPPYPNYELNFKALVRPAEPLRFEGALPPHYTHEVAHGEIELFQRYIRMLMGERQSLPEGPAELPKDGELYVKLSLLLPGDEIVTFAWVSLIAPFPYTYLAGRKVGDEIELPPSHLMPYVEVIRAVAPDFSPLSMEKATAQVRAVNAFTPASDEKLAEIFNLSELNEEFWRTLLEREVHRILDSLNLHTHRHTLLHAVGVDVPPEIAQINYLTYLQARAGKEQSRPLSYEAFTEELSWRLFMESHIDHVPDLEISEEELDADLWKALEARLAATEEGQSLLAQTASDDEFKQNLLRSFLGEKERDEVRDYMRYKRFDEWLLATYGPRPEKPLPLQTILLAAL